MLKEMGNQNTSGIVVNAKATESDSCDVEVQKTLPMENVSPDEKEAIDGCISEDSETKTNGLPNSTSESEEVIEYHNQSSAEMSAHQGNCDPSCDMENTENCIRNEKGVEDHPKVEMGSSLNVPHDLRPVSKDTSPLECEVNDEYLSLGETLTANKSSSGANTFHVDQTRVEEEVQGTNDVDEMVKEIGLVEGKESVRRDGKREEEKSTDERTVEEIGTRGNKPSALCEDGEDETSTEECCSEVGSPLEIKKVNKPELRHLFPCDILTTEQLLNKGPVLQTNGVESSQEKFRAKSESSLEIEKLNQLEPELDLVFLEQYTDNETSRLLVSEPNGGEITVERCGMKSESPLEIKKVDEPEPEPVYAFPKQYSVDKTTLSIQVLEPNPRENILERCKLTSESSSEINKVSEPEPKIEPRHVFSEQHPGVEKSTLQLLGENGAARILEKSRSQSESSFQIKRLNESELASKSECKHKAEPDSKQMLAKQYTKNETSIPQVPESKECETIEKLSTESNSNHPINQLELRKSPSFDFGLPLDSRSEESDQTPLLYQDRTAPRRFSSSSSYISPLHHEAVLEVEEKTIRMERSTSDVSRSPFLNLSKEDNRENLAVDKDEYNGLKSSLSTEECDGISTKRNGKRKPRSSLFTTCICCTSPSAFS